MKNIGDSLANDQNDDNNINLNTKNLDQISENA